MEVFFMVFCKQLELPKGSLTRRRGRRKYAGEAFAERRRSGRGFACKPQVSLLQSTIQQNPPNGGFCCMVKRTC